MLPAPRGTGSGDTGAGTRLLSHPDSPVCASRCSGRRTSRSTARERRQLQHGQGAQQDSGTGTRGQPSRKHHGQARRTRPPAPLPGAESPVNGHSPQNRHSPHRKGDEPHSSGFAITPTLGTAAASPAQTPQLLLGENQTMTATGTGSQGLATQPKPGEAEASQGCVFFDGSEETPPTATLLSFRWSSLTMT